MVVYCLVHFISPQRLLSRYGDKCSRLRLHLMHKFVGGRVWVVGGEGGRGDFSEPATQIQGDIRWGGLSECY